ncbi:hypothetical protein, partial [Bacillus thuringiensis]|uniref:hypothetical protein n=1 Tax=Bacillus thuringiensis TaxID=1428 RepID=UPI001CB9AC18
QVKVIVYETLYLLEMPKSRFKKVAASLCTFLCISLHFLLAQNTCCKYAKKKRIHLGSLFLLNLSP